MEMITETEIIIFILLSCISNYFQVVLFMVAKMFKIPKE